MIGKRVARFDNFVLTPLHFTLLIFTVAFLVQREWLLTGLFAADWLTVNLLGGSLVGASLPQAKSLAEIKQYDSTDKKKWKPDSEMSPAETRALWRAIFITAAVVGITVGVLVFHRSASIAEAAGNAAIFGLGTFALSSLIAVKT